MTQHNYYSYQMLMNNNSFNALSEADQQVLRDTALELDAYHDQLRDENVDKLLEDLKSQGVNASWRSPAPATEECFFSTVLTIRSTGCHARFRPWLYRGGA